MPLVQWQLVLVVLSVVGSVVQALPIPHMVGPWTNLSPSKSTLNSSPFKSPQFTGRAWAVRRPDTPVAFNAHRSNRPSPILARSFHSPAADSHGEEENINMEGVNDIASPDSTTSDPTNPRLTWAQAWQAIDFDDDDDDLWVNEEGSFSPIYPYSVWDESGESSDDKKALQSQYNARLWPWNRPSNTIDDKKFDKRTASANSASLNAADAEESMADKITRYKLAGGSGSSRPIRRLSTVSKSDPLYPVGRHDFTAKPREEIVDKETIPSPDSETLSLLKGVESSVDGEIGIYDRAKELLALTKQLLVESENQVADIKALRMAGLAYDQLRADARIQMPQCFASSSAVSDAGSSPTESQEDPIRREICLSTLKVLQEILNGFNFLFDSILGVQDEQEDEESQITGSSNDDQDAASPRPPSTRVISEEKNLSAMSRLSRSKSDPPSTESQRARIIGDHIEGHAGQVSPAAKPTLIMKIDSSPQYPQEAYSQLKVKEMRLYDRAKELLFRTKRLLGENVYETLDIGMVHLAVSEFEDLQGAMHVDAKHYLFNVNGSRNRPLLGSSSGSDINSASIGDANGRQSGAEGDEEEEEEGPLRRELRIRTLRLLNEVAVNLNDLYAIIRITNGEEFENGGDNEENGSDSSGYYGDDENSSAAESGWAEKGSSEGGDDDSGRLPPISLRG